MMTLNCITIDDEPLALNLINAYISKAPFLNLKKTFSKASEAVAGLKQPGIHLVFLDINMPGITGIEIARLLREHTAGPTPRVIFTTAHNQFAMESYQVEALDYLLKPFEYEDFLRAAQKALHFFETISNGQSTEDAIYVKTGYQQTRVLLSDILYIRGMRDYALIKLKQSANPIVTLTTLKSLNDKLPSSRFMRVQRSYIVALDSVTSLSTNSLWINDMEITIGEQYKTAVRSYFEKLL